MAAPVSSRLEPLDRRHAGAVLDFEKANREYFAATISDRGDDYFARFDEGFEALLTDQAAGVCAFYVLIDHDGEVVGRFNLYDIGDGSAVLGYRVAQRVTGRGVATAAVRELCAGAAKRHGLRTLRAAASDENVASRRVLAKAGFVPVGPAWPGGKRGTWFEWRSETPQAG